jgi:hypothetical protein
MGIIIYITKKKIIMLRHSPYFINLDQRAFTSLIKNISKNPENIAVYLKALVANFPPKKVKTFLFEMHDNDLTLLEYFIRTPVKLHFDIYRNLLNSIQSILLDKILSHKEFYFYFTKINKSHFSALQQEVISFAKKTSTSVYLVIAYRSLLNKHISKKEYYEGLLSLKDIICSKKNQINHQYILAWKNFIDYSPADYHKECAETLILPGIYCHLRSAKTIELYNSTLQICLDHGALPQKEYEMIAEKLKIKLANKLGEKLSHTNISKKLAVQIEEKPEVKSQPTALKKLEEKRQNSEFTAPKQIGKNSFPYLPGLTLFIAHNQKHSDAIADQKGIFSLFDQQSIVEDRNTSPFRKQQ